MVMLQNHRIKSKMDPLWTGPFEVLHRSKASTYRLRPEGGGAELGRMVPRHQLKVIELPEGVQAPAPVVAAPQPAAPGAAVPPPPLPDPTLISDHRGKEGKREYLVDYVGLPSAWVKPKPLLLPLIEKYWATIGNAKLHAASIAKEPAGAV